MSRPPSGFASLIALGRDRDPRHFSASAQQATPAGGDEIGGPVRLDMGRFLLLGAAISALFKTMVPAEFLLTVKDNVLLSRAVMMALAIVLSICSEADAFVAVSLGFFPRIAQLAFVSVGPMVDIKLISMYLSVFRRPVALRLIYVPIVMVYAMSVLVGGIPWERL